MNLKKLIANKYGVSILILLALLFTDVLLHRGETRMLISGAGADQVSTYRLPVCENRLSAISKSWISGVRSVNHIQNLPADAAGIYLELEWIDKPAHMLAVKNFTGFSFDSVVSAVRSVAGDCSFGFEIPETNPIEQTHIIQALKKIERQFQLKEKILVTAKNTGVLRNFCDSGFYTAFIVPPFEPYEAVDARAKEYCNNLAKSLSGVPTAALLTNLKKYPLLRKAFPSHHIITTAGNEDMSVIGFLTKRQLENDSMVAVTFFER